MLEKKDYVSVSKGVHKQKLQLAEVFVTSKNFILLSKKNTQIKILGSQSSVPRDPNGLCWLKNDSLCLRMKRSSKCYAACRCNVWRLDIQRPDQINFVLP